MELSKALTISALGLQVQGARLRALAATLANQDAAASSSTVGPKRQGVGSPAARPARGPGAEAVNASWSGPRGGERAPRLSPARAITRFQNSRRSPDADISTNGGSAHPIQDANLAVLEATRLLLTRTLDMLR